MKERRYNPAQISLTQLWTAIWLVVLVLFTTLWVNDAFAQRYDRYDGGGYRGWRSDMLEEQRRQTELMELQEQRKQERERRRNYEANKANVRAYHEQLRSGRWW